MGRRLVIWGGLARGLGVILAMLAVLLMGGCSLFDAEGGGEATSDAEATARVDDLLSRGPWFCSYRLVSDELSLDTDSVAVEGVSPQVDQDAGEGTETSEVVQSETADTSVLAVSVAIEFSSDDESESGVSATLSVSRGSAQPLSENLVVEIPEDLSRVELTRDGEAAAIIAWRGSDPVVSVAADEILGDLAAEESIVAPQGGATALLFTSSADAAAAASTVDVSNGLVQEGSAPKSSSATYLVDGYELYSPEEDGRWMWRKVQGATTQETD